MSSIYIHMTRRYLSGRKAKKNITKHRRMKHKRTKHNRVKHKRTKHKRNRSYAGDARQRIRTRSEHLQKKKNKECIGTIINTLINLEEAKTKASVLLQRIRHGGWQQAPVSPSEWKNIMNINTYRRANVENLKKEEIDPINGNIIQQTNEARAEQWLPGHDIGTVGVAEIHRLLALTIKNKEEELVNMVDDGNYLSINVELNDMVSRIAMDNTYIIIDEDGISRDRIAMDGINDDSELMLLLGGNDDGPEEDFRLTRELPPIRVKHEVNRSVISDVNHGLAAILNNARNPATMSIPLCETKKLSTLRLLTKVYNDQFIALIPYLPNYMYRAEEARQAAERDLQYEYDGYEADLDRGNVRDIVDLVSSSASDIEEMGETDGTPTSSIDEDGYVPGQLISPPTPRRIHFITPPSE